MSGAAALAAGVLVYREVFTPWQQAWGATVEETEEPLPGDDLLAAPAAQITRAITIDTDPAAVWPWLVQIGADRAGFYSYDWAENLVGLDIHSAESVVDDWQQLEVGDLVRASRHHPAGWYVVHLVPGEALVLQMADVRAQRPARRTDHGLEFQWTFVVRPAGTGRTRLLVRERVGFGSRRAQWLMAPTGVVSFVMTRRMLLGIKLRAERSAPSPPGAGRGRTKVPSGRVRRRYAAGQTRETIEA
ncbi:hypothetical protein [Nocardioides sp. TF02-7]|uniref:hypothetical protein n=1 Tax=Nocardioides sp. TF02-7 TaxID=2917724 RepID=UPI001F05D51A|nr:hypothetical protein [Nocardioides sp. TF02-7]UMG91875.1 hypothetical protein MF408_17830 [Nocardioides sp. TF02-7]